MSRKNIRKISFSNATSEFTSLSSTLFSMLPLFTSYTFCWLVRVSLFIELGGAEDLGTGCRGAFGIFMISRPI